eukprot:CAMPEP_0172389424 /NCGR_PEP_ID=MMETSP1061-20121228/6322_1 /TAXON_ID=37318 /ORGANISM="Pseudo-nitzschia pungens, Strain cf. pungens" /LENGTH=84 /DNA_ID=CAMNT_0013119573 /DNA_START=366 /DNA_END=620 /DNA_ORIENTATION=+
MADDNDGDDAVNESDDDDDDDDCIALDHLEAGQHNYPAVTSRHVTSRHVTSLHFTSDVVHLIALVVVVGGGGIFKSGWIMDLSQ